MITLRVKINAPLRNEDDPEVWNNIKEALSKAEKEVPGIKSSRKTSCFNETCKRELEKPDAQ